MKLDEIDHQILDILIDNMRTPFTDIAKKLLKPVKKTKQKKTKKKKQILGTLWAGGVGSCNSTKLPHRCFSQLFEGICGGSSYMDL